MTDMVEALAAARMALIPYVSDEVKQDAIARIDLAIAGLSSTNGDDGERVERRCEECKGSGIAEYIDHMARPCDACHGEGILTFTATEAGLLDQVAFLNAQLERMTDDCHFLLSVIDSCDEAEAPSCEMEPEDVFNIARIRAALNPIGEGGLDK
jgi:hypothetical protein